MICPVCNGRGEVRKHFLWIIRWVGQCRTCGGTGWVEEGGAGARHRAAVAAPDRRRESLRDWDDDRSTWPSRESSSGRDEPFVAGSGGRSGGGGGGASWGDASAKDATRAASDREHPVIVDPFVGDAAAVAAADAAPAEIDADAADGGSSDDSASSGDSGTSY